jgi:hypothetical protein
MSRTFLRPQNSIDPMGWWKSSGIFRRSRRVPLPEPELITNLYPIQRNRMDTAKICDQCRLILHFNPIEQDVLCVRIAFVRQPLNVQPRTLGDRARRGGFEVLAKMVRRNVRKRAELHLEARYSPRALLAGDRFNFPHQIVYEREFVHNSCFTIRKTSFAAAATSGERPTHESKFLPSIP